MYAKPSVYLAQGGWPLCGPSLSSLPVFPGLTLSTDTAAKPWVPRSKPVALEPMWHRGPVVLRQEH